jgi:hypothetical protein
MRDGWAQNVTGWLLFTISIIALMSVIQHVFGVCER